MKHAQKRNKDPTSRGKPKPIIYFLTVKEKNKETAKAGK